MIELFKLATWLPIPFSPVLVEKARLSIACALDRVDTSSEYSDP
ncbi:hypothetical protein [Spirosoma arboris]|nr:hypothetical protein [Spirosoma arboris]